MAAAVQTGNLQGENWNPGFATLHPAFRELPDNTVWQAWADWPDCACLSQQLPAGLCMPGGQPLQFLPQDAAIPYPALYYEERIVAHGIVSTRANWHDFFNAHMWALYPRSKVSISTRHVADLQNQPDSNRTPQRDALTVLDESGVLVVSADRQLLELIRDFAWSALFQQAAPRWGTQIDCFMFGHAVLEKLLNPYVGMTAHALLIEVAPDFFQHSRAAQRAQLDKVVAATLRADGLLSPLSMNPFPLLGVPGWWPQQDAAFYQNGHYFRAKSRERRVQILQAV